ncbi:tetratricopeptide repeat protein 17 [Anopheles cruzii]|uniref:tetratricopeptide repeat protein 17 n=1 Tax=Anopheles cruzii TaxID=68878 RepID=UPI0022EC3C8B|nr:tetratricopeptide repeat protein 17 [Anopheles cruzii]
MLLRKNLFVLLILLAHDGGSVEGSTHWLLNTDGLIIPQLSSPFYLRRSYDLIAFLNQHVYKQKIDLIIGELLAIKSNLTAKMNNLDQYTNELTSKIGCIPDYYLDESDILSTIVNPSYVSRIGKLTEKEGPASFAVPSTARHKSGDSASPGEPPRLHRPSASLQVPKCTEFMPLDVSVAAFDHLEGVHNRSRLRMAPEEVLMSLEYNIPKLLTDGLRWNPGSWKMHTIASYYWRLKGNAPEAMECARRAVTLAPRPFKDIALLSLGTILQRSQHLNDSLLVLLAAVEHDATEPENQLALGNTYMLLSEFNRSFEAYRVTESLSRLYSKQINYIKKSVNCFKDLKINLLKMESLLQDIIPGLELYGALQKEFDEYHEKLDREQAPLKTRVFDESYSHQVDFLIQRSQICTTRLAKDKGEPVVSCDFISDVQMLMEDFAVEILNNYVDLKRELINTYKINSLGIYKKVFVEHF